MIKWDGQFTVAGAPDAVMERFTDVARMATCMPGASLGAPAEDGAYPGEITVAFGPKKVKFTGRLTCEFDLAARSGTLVGRGAGAARGSNVAVTVRFSVTEAAGEPGPRSLVRIGSQAEFGGILGEFAKAGGATVANVLLDEFARNVAHQFEGGEAGEPATPQPALSAGSLVWRALKEKIV